MAPNYDPPSMSLRPVNESMALEDIDRAARAYGWEIGRGKNLAEVVELSDDNPFKNSNWRELIESSEVET